MTANKTSTDKRYRVSPKGIILDSRTGEQWFVGPDVDTDWNKANAWVKRLDVDGSVWRMPTIGELENIYETEKTIEEDKHKHSLRLDPVFKITGTWVWAEERDSSSASVFDFWLGLEGWFGCRSYANCRVLCVASGHERKGIKGIKNEYCRRPLQGIPRKCNPRQRNRP